MLFARLVSSVRVGVIDAGSTGTRLKLVDFDQDTISSQSLFKSEDMPDAGGKKGLHQCSSNEARQIIRHLLMQSKMHKDTVLGFYGTAGLRSVSPEKQSYVLDAVREAARDYNLVECKVITGNEEALYSLKGFEYLRPNEQSFSIIDMGGRSVQIIQRDGLEIRLSSLQMGILNSKCTENNLFGTLKKVLRLSSGLYEYTRPKDALSYICRENHATGGVWSFGCSLCVDICGRGTKSLPTSSSKPVTSTVEEGGGLGTHSLGHLTAGSRRSDLPLYDIQDLAPNVSSNKDVMCIDEFLRSMPVEKLKTASRIYLMSFFEEIVEKSEATTLSHLLEGFKQKCPDHLGDDCLKFYYSIQFLRKIGVDGNSDIRVMNRMQGVDVSWSLGKALELRDRALNDK